MIPDQPFNFNNFDAGSNFQAPEARLHHAFQQDATPILEIGRHLLFVCPVCKRPWYKADRREYPRLTPEQLASLGAALQVDIQALYVLPKAICPICSTLHLGGMFSAEAYPNHRGYHFRWESVSPRRIQLLAMVHRAEGLTLDALLEMISDPFAEPLEEMRALLTWLEMCPSPDTVQALTGEQCQRWPGAARPGTHSMDVSASGTGMPGRCPVPRWVARHWSRSQQPSRCQPSRRAPACALAGVCWRVRCARCCEELPR
jgi:hypothetical protein